MKCERCGAEPESEYGLHDYCANCSRNLCPKCMGEGCCGHVPARSGMMNDVEVGDDDGDTGEDTNVEDSDAR